MYEYGDDFYRFLASFAVRSAQRILPKLTAVIPVGSVVDFGCGNGAWLSAWAATGASVIGVDGDYVDRKRLMIDPGEFHAADLSRPIDLGRRFDLVQCLEVAEHLPAAVAGQLISTLTAHGDIVLFSAALPGQGGENHINEQPLDYWRAIFRKHGYTVVDYLRPLIFDDAKIARWYRYNVLLYIKDEKIASLPERVRSCRVSDDQELGEYRPLPYRVRDALVRRLPYGAVNRASRLKALAATRRAKA